MVGGAKSTDADERFQHITTDPRFRTLKRSKHKVKADSRWRSMMKDERFTHKATAIDKRGRPKYTSMKEDYRRLVCLDWYFFDILWLDFDVYTGILSACNQMFIGH